MRRRSELTRRIRSQYIFYVFGFIMGIELLTSIFAWRVLANPKVCFECSDSL